MSRTTTVHCYFYTFKYHLSTPPTWFKTINTLKYTARSNIFTFKNVTLLAIRKTLVIDWLSIFIACRKAAETIGFEEDIRSVFSALIFTLCWNFLYWCQNLNGSWPLLLVSQLPALCRSVCERFNTLSASLFNFLLYSMIIDKSEI